jgi:hypothetical protein
MHPVVYHYVVLLLLLLLLLLCPLTEQIPNKETKVPVLTFVYYSVSATTCFVPAGSSSGSFHGITLVTEFFLIWIHIGDYININFVANF